MSPDIDPVRQEAAEGDAVAWRVRLSAGAMDEAACEAFLDWLEAAPENLPAYETAARIEADLVAAAPALLSGLDGATVVDFAARRRTPGPSRRLVAGVGALAAAAAALTVFVAVRPAPPAPAEVYQTAKGESRAVQLADGSRIQMASASRLSVRFEKAVRHVDLSEGEATFDVAHDSARPFLINAGERDIRVVGTEFDVLRHDGRLRVTVRRGVVAVQQPSAAAGEPVLLRAGDQFQHRAGERRDSVRKVDPDAVFAWRSGQLIYADQPLGDVVSDLNRYFSDPVRIDPAASDLRFSGVLKLDRQDDVMRRLEGFLPLSVQRSSSGYDVRLRRAPS